MPECPSVSPQRQLLYCATVFGVGVNDASLRTDWWRASYLPNQTVPGINKPANLIEITEDAVHLRVTAARTVLTPEPPVLPVPLTALPHERLLRVGRSLIGDRCALLALHSAPTVRAQ